MLEILKNNWNRLLEEKSYLFVSMVLTIFAVAAAIVLTSTIETKGNIAVVSTDAQAQIIESQYFNITLLDSVPTKSELVQNRYDAVVIIKDGSYTVDTIKSDDVKSMIYKVLENPDTFVLSMDTTRKIGTNIIGYMMMFILMQGVFYARLFAEDKEKHMIERVAMSPLAIMNYLLGHVIFIIALIFIPSFSVIVVAKIIGVTIGFSLLTYAGLIAVLSILSTTFALFLNSLFCVADTANMLGSSIIVLSSILAGSFYSFTKEETLFNKLLHILPQKDFINYVDALENRIVSNNIEWQFFYVIGLSIVFFVFAIVKTRRDYIDHR